LDEVILKCIALTGQSCALLTQLVARKIWYGGIDVNEKWRSYWNDAWQDDEIGEFLDHQIAWKI